jgi:hypothetical protein
MQSHLMHFRLRWQASKQERKKERENVECNKNPMSLEIIVSKYDGNGKMKKK